MDFDWDENNIAHIARHGVEPYEAEQVLLGGPLALDYSDIDGEVRFRDVGQTLDGRVLVVVSTTRGSLTRVVTAYEPGRTLKLVYLAERERFYGKENHS
jgi:uncharacterized DUF497 family protein